MDSPGVTVVIVEEHSLNPMSSRSSYRAFTVPLVRDWVFTGDTPEKALRGLKELVRYFIGPKNRLHQIVSVNFDELIVEDVMNE